jgi:hypothetical protein
MKALALFLFAASVAAFGQTAFRLESSAVARSQWFTLREFETLTIEDVHLTERGNSPRIEVIYPESPFRRYQVIPWATISGPAEIYFQRRGSDDSGEGAMIHGTIRRTYRRTIAPASKVELFRSQDLQTWHSVLAFQDEAEAGFYQVKVSPY